MRALLRVTTGALALAGGAASCAFAQGDEFAFAVTYIEVTPSATTETIALLRERASASRAADGNVRYQVLQRTGRPNHFAILDAWESQAARAADASARHTRSFRAALEPLLYSPYDERPGEPIMGTAGYGGEGQIYSITHVDIIPTALEEGTALVDELVRTSREQPGAVDIGIVAQESRRNHMTLFEVWTSAEHRIANAGAPHMRRIRNELLSRTGSLYDERLYHRL